MISGKPIWTEEAEGDIQLGLRRQQFNNTVVWISAGLKGVVYLNRANVGV